MNRNKVRSADLEQKKFHVPMINRGGSDGEKDVPPYIVAVQGPPGVRNIYIYYKRKNILTTTTGRQDDSDQIID